MHGFLAGKGSGRSLTLTAAAVFVAAALPFLPTLFFGFVWDDPLILEHIRGEVEARGPLGLLTAEYRADVPVGYYRPLTVAAGALAQSAGGGAPWAFHLESVLLHSAVSALLFLVISRLIPSTGAALFGALLFAFHPVHVESVAMVSNRHDLLAALLLLAAALAWLGRPGAPDAGGKPPGAGALAAGGLCFLGATLSKESAFLLPPALLAWDLARADEGSRWTGWPRRNAPWLAAWALAAGAAFALRAVAGAGWGAGDAAARPDPGLLAGMAVSCLRLLSLPWPLSAYYTPSQVTLSSGSLWPLAGAALTLAVFAGAAARGAGRAGLPGAAWFAAFLLPVSGILPLGGAPVADRYLYIPSIGFALAAAGLASRLRLPRPVAFLAGSALLAFLLAGTLARLPVWKDDLALFTATTAASPDYAVGRYNLGNALREKGRIPEAEREYRAALALDPGLAMALSNLGMLRLEGGDARGAEELFRRALAKEPAHPVALLGLGMALVDEGRYREAARALEEGEAARPRDADLLLEQGYAWELAGEPARAAAARRRAAGLRPSGGHGE
jgi:protein O-mannosyl-transferase